MLRSNVPDAHASVDHQASKGRWTYELRDIPWERTDVSAFPKRQQWHKDSTSYRSSPSKGSVPSLPRTRRHFAANCLEAHSCPNSPHLRSNLKSVGPKIVLSLVSHRSFRWSPLSFYLWTDPGLESCWRSGESPRSSRSSKVVARFVNKYLLQGSQLTQKSSYAALSKSTSDPKAIRSYDLFGESGVATFSNDP